MNVCASSREHAKSYTCKRSREGQKRYCTAWRGSNMIIASASSNLLPRLSPEDYAAGSGNFISSFTSLTARRRRDSAILMRMSSAAARRHSSAEPESPTRSTAPILYFHSSDDRLSRDRIESPPILRKDIYFRRLVAVHPSFIL